MLVDSHCHLDFPELLAEEADVIARAREAGVRGMLTISTRLSTFPKVLELAGRHEGVWCATGVHPHQSGEEGPSGPQPLIENARHPEVIGIGEAGLDYFYDKSPRDAQAAGFRAHIEAAQATGLPLIVHTRDAEEDTIRILEEGLAKGPFACVIHCYSSSPWLGERAVELGFHLGVGGILTFNKSTELRETVARMPRERIILETDSPYLAPVPRRGKRNEPAFVAHVAGKLAEVWGCGVADVASTTTDNFFNLFTKADRPA
ncbi:MAG: TatD family hydrolase [Geminicoccaceae bacterium]|nr:TatD family hydrolase [Geminicoccaceae bacterium]